MAFTYGFFNSVNGDRLYNAEQLSHIFEGLISDGVYEAVGNKLAVAPSSGMTIQIKSGRGWFNKHWVNNDSAYNLTLEASDVVLNRYVAVCIRVDNNDSVRSAVPYLKYSEFATTPVKPTMTRTELINEYCLAYIYIGHGVSEITASVIEDTRQNTELCGWVTGLIDQITPDTLYTQFTAIFNNWFEGLVDIIDEDVETTLVNAMTKCETITIPVDAWEDNAADVMVVNMSATKSVLIMPNDETETAYNNAGIKCTAQSTNMLTFTCDTTPTADVKVDIIHSGV